MKYVVVLGDGMADWPLESLGGGTPLSCARTPAMTRWPKSRRSGQCNHSGGNGAGSDTANLSVMGYDPRKYYTGRSPLEALSIGVDMKDTDVVYRCNLVTLTEEDAPYEEQDHPGSQFR